jgi:hypothetical protein
VTSYFAFDHQSHDVELDWAEKQYFGYRFPLEGLESSPRKSTLRSPHHFINSLADWRGISQPLFRLWGWGIYPSVWNPDETLHAPYAPSNRVESADCLSWAADHVVFQDDKWKYHDHLTSDSVSVQCSCLEELLSKEYYSSKVLWAFFRATTVRCQLGLLA